LNGGRAARAAEGSRAGAQSWTGGAIALLLTAVALYSWSYRDQWVASAPAASFRIAAGNLLIALIAGGVVALLCRFIVGRWWPRAPALYVGVLSASLIMLLTLSPGVSRLGWLIMVLVIVGCSTAAGTALWTVRKGSRRRRGWVTLAIAAAIGFAATIGLLVPRGSPPTPLAEEPSVPAASADFARPGPHQVAMLTYGSGEDRLREEYRNVDFTTDTVDLSEILEGWEGADGGVHTQRWGFDATNLPLNARAWYPTEGGPYPLAVIVHGNKSSAAYSESGYDYLAKQLASHGFVTVAIDENFLNTTLLDSSAPIQGSEIARSVLILEHLAMLAGEESQLGTLEGKLDPSQISLIGHSRGGEAVATASALNTVGEIPEHPQYRLPSGFGIESVVALAPTDGQYQPGGKPVALSGVNYLVLHGSHDVDVASFAGANQYARTAPTEEQFKAMLYVGGANHSQFNSAWGRRDIGNGLPKLFINTATLLEPSQQRLLAAGYTTAFLEATIKGGPGEELFRDHRAGRAWLPATRYLGAHASGNQVELLTGTDDAEKETGSLAGSTVAASGASVWREAANAMRAGPSDERVQVLTGDGGRALGLTVELAEPVDLSSHANIILDAAIGDGTSRLPLQLTLTDASGESSTSAVPYGAPPPIVGDALMASWMRVGGSFEPILESLVVPLEDFAEVNLSEVTAVQITAQPYEGTLLIGRIAAD